MFAIYGGRQDHQSPVNVRGGRKVKTEFRLFIRLCNVAD